MRRAEEVFEFEQRATRSPLVEQVWQTRSGADDRFISAAVSHWEMVVTRLADTTEVTVRGPETRATSAAIPSGATFFGIQFSLGTFMPRLPPGQLVDGSMRLSRATKRSVWLDGSRVAIPEPEDVDAFVAGLVDAGVLIRDPVVAAAADGNVQPLSSRSIQRRVARATGLRARPDQADPPCAGRGAVALRRHGRARRGASRRLRRPASPDQVAEGVGRPDPRRDRDLGRRLVAVVFVQDRAAVSLVDMQAPWLAVRAVWPVVASPERQTPASSTSRRSDMGAARVHEFITVDGVIENPAWTAEYGFDPKMGDAIAKLMGSSTALLMGRKTYEMFAPAWSRRTADEDPGAPFMNETPKYVVSTTLRDPEWNNSTVLGAYSPQAIRSLKERTDGDIYVSGSGMLVRALLADQLVDELHLFVYPLALGEGQRLFGDGLRATFTLAESEAYDNGTMHLAYRPA